MNPGDYIAKAAGTAVPWYVPEGRMRPFRDGLGRPAAQEDTRGSA